MKVVRKKRISKVLVAVIILIVVLAVVGSAFYVIKNKKTDTITTPTKTTSNTNTTKNTTTNNNGSITSSPDKSTSAAVISADVTPRDPTGTFVSNHSPNISGTPAPNIESSTCTTTPGAKCTIQFTKDGITKSLEVKTTDSSGNASWDSWTLSSVGLTEGKWTITALATNGSKSATSVDLTVLNVEK